MQIYKIDEQGFYIEPVIIREGTEVPEDCIEVRPPNGLYRPKWNGKNWVEGMAQEEIDEIQNRPSELTEIENLKVAVAETYEEATRNSIETKLAIADLIEILTTKEVI